MNSSEVRQFIKGINDLPTIPALLGKILSIIKDENSSSQDLFRLISHDQALAERVVRVANSALFGHSGQVKDLEQAIIFLGYDKIKAIAAGMTIMDVFPAQSSFNIKNLWIHSYEAAFLASTLSDMIPMTSPRECFLSGLLHDIGRIIFYMINHEDFHKIQITDKMLEFETELFGCTHSDAGSWFAEETGMPAEIVAVTRYHHKPSAAKEYKDAVSIISLAEALTQHLSPHIEGDGIWTKEHDAILLEFSLTDDKLMHIGDSFLGAKPVIEKFF